MKQVLLLSKYTRLGASTRLRTMQFIPNLENAGYVVIQQSLFDDDYLKKIYTRQKVSPLHLLELFFKRVFCLLKVRSYDIVWIEYELLPYVPAWFEKLIKLFCVKYVVDYDDAIFHNYDLSSNKVIRSLLGNKIDNVMANATAVVAGNDYLANRARIAGAKTILKIPTVIDLNRYPMINRHANDNLVIGWIGSPSTQKYILQFAEVFSELAKNHDFTLKLVGASNEIAEQLPNIKVEVLSWKEELEVDYIRSFDIGIMPLNDGPWEKGKCGYKLIQYMACSIPVVASPVGVNSRIVADNHCGLLASTLDEFIASLNSLLMDKKLRSVMGKAGRKAVENQYSVQAQSSVLISLFNYITGNDK